MSGLDEEPRRRSTACHVMWSTSGGASGHLCRERGPHLIHVCECGETMADLADVVHGDRLNPVELVRSTDPAYRSRLRQEVDEDWQLVRAWCDL